MLLSPKRRTRSQNAIPTHQQSTGRVLRSKRTVSDKTDKTLDSTAELKVDDAVENGKEMLSAMRICGNLTLTASQMKTSRRQSTRRPVRRDFAMLSLLPLSTVCALVRNP